MTDLRVQATVSADGRQASAELKRLAGDVANTKQAMVEAKLATRAAADALRTQARAATEDTAAIDRLRDALIAARAAEVLATREHAAATATMNAQGRAAQNLAGNTNQARASMANLGQQVGDVATGIAAGTPAFTILAQQGGQIAFAMSGLGGKLGAVASFLSGPWGAAILGGTIVLGSLWSASNRVSEKQAELAAKKAQVKTAADLVTEAIKAEASAQEQFDALLKRSSRTEEEEIIRQGRLAAERLKGAEAIRAQTRALLEQEKQKLAGDLARANDPQFANEFGNAALPAIAARSGRISDINQQLRDLDAAAAADQRRVLGADALIGLRRATELTDAAAAATARYKAEEARLFSQRQAGTISQKAYEAALVAAKNSLERAMEAARSATRTEREAAKSAKDRTAENEKLAEAYNPLLAAQQDYRKALEDITKAEARGIASAGQASEARLAAADKLRRARLTALGGTATGPIQLAGAGDITDTLSGRVFAGEFAREMERVLGPEGLGRELGIRTGQEFGRAALEFSQVIGNGLAGGFARALQRSTALAALADRLVPGQGAGVSEGFRDVITGVANGFGIRLEKLFDKDGKFAKALGGVLGGAAVGGGVADIANTFGAGFSKLGSEIGGAIGGLESTKTALDSIASGLGQFAPIIGSVLGGIVGGILAPRNPFADVALTSSAAGVDSRLFNSRGDSSGNQGLSLAGAFGNQLSQLASALGGEIRAGLNLGAIGFSGDKFFFNPTGGDFKAAGNQRFNSAEEAVAAAVANALSTGAIATSPRVQAVLQRYASNVNQAVAEALKVKNLEELLEAQGNPFAAAFRDFERQARQRLEVARQYGFEIVEIEKLNADQRAALIRDTLQGTTGSAKALLDDFRFGDRAGGSVRDRLTSLGGERDRLAGLVRGGDGSQLDALAEVIRQIDDLQREAFGATGEAANGRAASAALLQELIDATEARVRAAAEEAQRAAAEQIGALRSMDATLEDLHGLGRQQVGILGGILAALQPAGSGSYDFDLARSVQR